MAEERPFSEDGTAVSSVEVRLLPTWRPPSGRMIFASLGLLVVTFLTALVVGTYHTIAFYESVGPSGMGFLGETTFLPAIWRKPGLLGMGLPYAVVLLSILLSHELGHYLFCWRYRVDATLPVFIPAPSLIGTFGAFIRIRGIIPHRDALLDIGVAGPLTGFLVSLPFLAIGVLLSQPVSIAPAGRGDGGAIYFGEPLIWKLLVWLLRQDPPGTDLLIHPIALAAWFGILATNLNLFPIGQLDGGHVAYAVLGPRARWLSRAFWAGLVVLVFHNFVWAAWTLMTLFIGFRHPPTYQDDRPLDPRRQWWALAAAGVFVLTFMPDPVRIRL